MINKGKAELVYARVEESEVTWENKGADTSTPRTFSFHSMSAREQQCSDTVNTWKIAYRQGRVCS